MGRSVLIFVFFAMATVAVIVFQPGPREMAVHTPLTPLGTSRNDTSLLAPSSNHVPMALPDKVISDIKAVRNGTQTGTGQPVAPRSQAPAGASVDQLQAALQASLQLGQSQQFVTDAADIPVMAAQPYVPAPKAQPSMPYTAPAKPERTAAITPVSQNQRDLRSMSWQSLNSLQQLRQDDVAVGQEGSLMNSIVRRSMAHVGSDTPSPQFRSPAASVSGQGAAPQVSATPQVRQSFATQTSSLTRPIERNGLREYEVVPGDYLALIAVKLYGSALSKDQLLADNPELRANPNSLKIGQKLFYRTR